jgi:hypothetical protein
MEELQPTDFTASARCADLLVGIPGCQRDFAQVIWPCKTTSAGTETAVVDNPFGLP